MSKPLGNQLPWINHSVTAGMFDTAVTAQLLLIIAEKTYNTLKTDLDVRKLCCLHPLYHIFILIFPILLLE